VKQKVETEEARNRGGRKQIRNRRVETEVETEIQRRVETESETESKQKEKQKSRNRRVKQKSGNRRKGQMEVWTVEWSVLLTHIMHCLVGRSSILKPSAG
jgi:hypothetical protein